MKKQKAKQKPTKTKRTPKLYEWTTRDQHRAEKEGWAIFEAHGGQEIEADQDSTRFKRKGVYRDDLAVRHVCRRAIAGSRFHVRALVIHLRDVIDIMKVAHGYAVDEEIPEKPEPTRGPSPGRYNHQFTIAYSVHGDEPTGDDVSGWNHYHAIHARAYELLGMSIDEVRETVANNNDTYDTEEASSGERPAASDDPETTG